MASNTYTGAAVGVSFAANKSMIGLYNGTGSGQILRVYRIWILNNQTVAVTGTITNLEIRRCTALSGGTSLTPIKHDSNNTAIPGQVIASTGGSPTLTDLFRRALWSTDEPSANATATIDELQTLIPLGCIWDVGYGDATVEPIVCREGQGVSLQSLGATTGVADVFIEFTMAAS